MLDTSVVITGLRSSTGAAAETIRLVLLTELTILMDYKLICEYRDVALREEQLVAFGKSHAEVKLLLDALEAMAEPIQVLIKHHPLSMDANDDMVLELAINGGADAIVTWNTKHFLEPAKRFKLQVCTPAELLQELRNRR